MVMHHVCHEPQQVPPAIQLMTAPQDKPNGPMYIVRHYDGTERARVLSIERAVSLIEHGRDPTEFGRHCVIRDGRVVYWSRRTDNADRRTVREDFIRDGHITEMADALEAGEDEQGEVSVEKVFDGARLDEETEALLSGREGADIVSYKVTLPKAQSETIVVTRERGNTLAYSYSISGCSKLYAESQFKALKFALKRFRMRLKVDCIRVVKEK